MDKSRILKGKPGGQAGFIMQKAVDSLQLLVGEDTISSFDALSNMRGTTAETSSWSWMMRAKLVFQWHPLCGSY